MIRIEIEGVDGTDAANQMSLFVNGISNLFQPIPAPPATGQAAQTETPATDNAQPAASEQHFPAPAKRGRKPDTPEERAAKKAAREAAKNAPVEGAVSMAASTSPAGGESENTGSTAPVSFPAGEPASASASDGAAASSSAASITEAQMREALNALIEAIGGDPGMVAASAIVKKYGYVRVREIKAEHFAAIAADAERVLRERVQVVPA